MLKSLFAKNVFYVCCVLMAVFSFVGAITPSAYADADDQPYWFPKLLGMQFNGIYQYLPSFDSPYAGPHSFRSGDDLSHKLSQIYGVYLGSRITPSAQIYFDIEMARGSGISNSTGLGGLTNGDVIRQGGGTLTHGPYVARLYLRKLFPLSGETEKVEKGMDQLPGNEPTSRVEFKIGKMAAADDFDLNRYANNTRTQFMNWGFINNTAWDFAADTRGYSYGFVAALVKPTWRLAFGSYMMPRTANGSV
ncbi:MAG TPA: carbohydrate porin, partial [Syntrophorhabdales bacterium]|nr:carbohydrate porin [Syntrophorhabdales bacterium]